MKVWLDGRLVATEDARIAPTDRGLLLGDGLFETILVRGGKPQRLDAHLARLAQGAQVLGFALPAVDFAAAMDATLAANALADAALRLTVTRGSGPRGVLPPAEPRPTVLITTAPLAPPAPPAHCVVATTTRRNEHSPLSRIKSLNYLDNVLARLEAAQRSADDAILLNTAGRVAEATAANVFVVKDGQLITPPIADGALPGVIRTAVLALGAVEQILTIDDLKTADAAFLTSSLSVRAIASVDGQPLRSDPVIDRIRQAVMPG